MRQDDFDSLTIRLPQPVLLISQENHYYPFCMNLSGVAVNTLPAEALSKRQYNGGSLLEDDLLDGEGANYSTPYRRYDATIGRFLGVDPLADVYNSQTPFVFASNDPVNGQDPTGAYEVDDFGNIRLKGGRGRDLFANPHLDPISGIGVGMGQGLNSVSAPGITNPWSTHDSFIGMGVTYAQMMAATQQDGIYANGQIWHLYKGGLGVNTNNPDDYSFSYLESTAVGNTRTESGAQNSGFWNNNWMDATFTANATALAFVSANTTLTSSWGYRLPQTKVFIRPFGELKVSTKLLRGLSVWGGKVATVGKLAPAISVVALGANIYSSQQLTLGHVYTAAGITAGIALTACMAPIAAPIALGLAVGLLAAEGISQVKASLATLTPITMEAL